MVSLDLEELGEASSSSGAVWSGSTSAAAESMTLLAPGGELGPDVDGCGVAVAPSLPSGGGLPEIAAMTAGTYREINGPDDLDELPAAKTGPSAAARGGVLRASAYKCSCFCVQASHFLSYLCVKHTCTPML